MQNAWINWLWIIDDETNRLVLQLSDDICFPTELKPEQINIEGMRKMPFSAQDAELYSAFRENLENTELNQQGQFTVAINATAACSYSIPLAAKSWLFKATECVLNKRVGDIVQLVSDEEADYMVLEKDEQSSLVILVSEHHQISVNRCFKQGYVIRVHNDRLKRI